MYTNRETISNRCGSSKHQSHVEEPQSASRVLATSRWQRSQSRASCQPARTPQPCNDQKLANVLSCLSPKHPVIKGLCHETAIFRLMLLIFNENSRHSHACPAALMLLRLCPRKSHFTTKTTCSILSTVRSAHHHRVLTGSVSPLIWRRSSTISAAAALITSSSESRALPADQPADYALYLWQARCPCLGRCSPKPMKDHVLKPSSCDMAGHGCCHFDALSTLLPVVISIEIPLPAAQENTSTTLWKKRGWTDCPVLSVLDR